MKKHQTPSADQLEKRINDLLSQMTIHDKIGLLSGSGGWAMGKVDRLGIPGLKVTDGPHGLRMVKATAFPSGISLAATWNTDLMERVGVALGEETLATGYDILLGPCVNMIRHPLGGRNFETYAEDPYLAGRMGVAYVQGVQSKNIGTSLKHFACNNQEIERGRGSSVIDERTLREMYLPHFEMVVKEAKPWTVMCSYNRINSVHASQNHYLLTQILRTEWGYEGVVISDWAANHTIRESVEAGLDVEMPGPAKYFGGHLAHAIDAWQTPVSVIDTAVTRILRLYILSGRMEKKVALPKGSINTVAHQTLARTVAHEAMVLLKNENHVLPFDMKKIKRLAVIGPAADHVAHGGGSSLVDPPYSVSLVDALHKKFGKSITICEHTGCANYIDPPEISPDQLVPLTGKGKGFSVDYFANTSFSGAPALSRIENGCNLWYWESSPKDGVLTKDKWSARFSTTFTPQTTGPQILSVKGIGDVRVSLNGKEVAHAKKRDRFREGTNRTFAEATLLLTKGESYSLTIEFIKNPDEACALCTVGLGREPISGWDHDIAEAALLAASCDAAIVCCGLPSNYETEGHDRPHMDLTGQQNKLIEKIALSQPKTAVVINAGSPVTMPWIDTVQSLVLAWYPGMEGGAALADIISGSVNPSGKLPVTFPKRLQDTPAFINYPGTREVVYGEGIFMGYRYYDVKDVEPLFPFGHGLSYTTFSYGKIKAPKQAIITKDMTVSVSVPVTNTGKVAGTEVVQLYIKDTVSSLIRPLQELKGFSKIVLKPGESKVVTFELNYRSFAFYNPYEINDWVVEPGAFEIRVGGSSRDIRSKQSIVLNLT